MSLERLLARLAPPLAAGLSLAVLAGLQGDAAAAAESAYLALLAAAALLPAAALSPAAGTAAWGAALAVVVGWSVPAGPARGAAIVAGLVLTLALALGEVLGHRPGPRSALDWRTALAAALGLQVLCRSRLLLDLSLDPATLVRLLGLPLAGAAAVLYLSKRSGPPRALLAAAAALAMTAGWTVPSVLALLALVAADLAGRGDLPVAARWTVLLLPAAAASARDPRLALVLLFLALAAVPGRRVLAALGGGGALAAALLVGRLPWTEAWIGLAWLPLLVPTAFLPAGTFPGRLLAASALALAGLRLVPPDVALAGPLAWIALGLPERPSRNGLQRVWSGGLLAATALLAAYPWFREAPLAAALERLGLAPAWGPALVVTALAGGLAWLAERGGQRAVFAPRPAAAGLLLAALAALAALPRVSARPLDGGVALLTAESPSWSVELPAPVPVSAIVLDSHLAEAATLPAGTPVATLRLETDAGERRLELLAGRDSGEWAARRPDVAARPGFDAPPPWLSWPAPERFFAQRYRTRKELPAPLAVRGLTLERRADLPPRTRLVTFHLELRR